MVGVRVGGIITGSLGVIFDPWVIASQLYLRSNLLFGELGIAYNS